MTASAFCRALLVSIAQQRIGQRKHHSEIAASGLGMLREVLGQVGKAMGWSPDAIVHPPPRRSLSTGLRRASVDATLLSVCIVRCSVCLHHGRGYLHKRKL